MRKFVHEMVLPDDRPVDNDVDAAVDDVRMYAIECFERVTSLKKVKLKTTLPYMGLD